MGKNKIKIEDLYPAFFIIGIILTVGSFLLYHLLNPSFIWMIPILIVDFIYLCLNIHVFNSRFLGFWPTVFISLFYIILFFGIALLILAWISTELVVSSWYVCLYYAFFTGPSLILLLPLLWLICEGL